MHFTAQNVTDTTMKRFGLIGHPVAHSLSPALFKAAYAGKYPYDLIEGEDFEASYQKFLEEYDAINVTAPFKEMAFRKADIVTEECKAIGATNLLVKTPEGVKAYNSDYLGVRRWLEERSLDFARDDKRETQDDKKEGRDGREEGRDDRGDGCDDNTGVMKHDYRIRVLVVGYGGAGKAVAAAAESLGMEVRIMNRTRFDETVIPLEDFCMEFRKADIIVYNIPAPIDGLSGFTAEDFRGGDTPKRKYILEANYRNPSFTQDILDRMNKVNPLATYTQGQIWLLYQAVTGYELFTGKAPDLEKMRKVL